MNDRKDLVADRLAHLQAEGAVPMTAEEILAGNSQAGVPRPAFLKYDEDDGSIERVSSAAVNRGADQ